jgi:hypothetical protein
MPWFQASECEEAHSCHLCRGSNSSWSSGAGDQQPTRTVSGRVRDAHGRTAERQSDGIISGNSRGTVIYGLEGNVEVEERKLAAKYVVRILGIALVRRRNFGPRGASAAASRVRQTPSGPAVARTRVNFP